MDDHHLFSATSFGIFPTNSGAGHTAEIKDAGGTPIGSWNPSGDILDASGSKVLSAPMQWDAPRRGPFKVELQILDASGEPLGAARVAKYTLGPKSKKLTVSISDTTGTEVGRIAPLDKKGEQLGVTVGEIQVGTVEVSTVKAGFLRKNRVYSARFMGSISEAARPLVVGTLLRYDALVDGVISASTKDSARS
jgi:hypothetical protein